MDRLIQRNLMYKKNSKATLTHFVTTPTARMVYIVISFMFDSYIENGIVEGIGGIPKTLSDEALLRKYSYSNFYDLMRFPSYFDETD